MGWAAHTELTLAYDVLQLNFRVASALVARQLLTPENHKKKVMGERVEIVIPAIASNNMANNECQFDWLRFRIIPSHHDDPRNLVLDISANMDYSKLLNAE